MFIIEPNLFFIYTEMVIIAKYICLIYNLK